MWEQTREKAEETKRFYEERFDFQFIIREVPGGRGFSVNAIRNCSRCGDEMEQGGGFDKKAICENCTHSKKVAILTEAHEAGERSRADLRAYDDFEEICQ